jgi:hypothetical protein
MKNPIGILCVLGLLSGCGGNTKNDVACSGLDWEKLGFDTATSGQSVRTFDSYRKSCGKDLETGAMDTYIDGYTRGVIEYCTYENGYSMGVANKPIPEVCPVEAAGNFSKGYKVGQFETSEKIRKMDQLQEDSDFKNREPMNAPGDRSGAPTN